MRIGELAKLANISPETVRYYERFGLLSKPNRTDNNYRDYDKTHLDQLQFIRNCRAVDITLEEVKRLSHFRDRPNLACQEINVLLDDHIAKVDSQIRELQTLVDTMRELRACCDSPRTAGDCGVLARLSKHAKAPRAR